ncbi:MAG: exodeoxyribonuclease III [Synergistaceae bacterium]|nr:exodeoxyribonuclease III [Synergistaceae bacterium]
MLITTFNVNSVRSRLPILTRWLQENHPSLLFMQETKTQDSSFPSLAFSELGYTSYFCGEKSYNGVAVLVKNSITDIHVSFGFDNGEYSSRVLTLRHKGLTILNTYVPQGKELDSPSYTEKKYFLGRVRKIIERESSGMLFLWLGDLNVAPEPIDVAHPETKKHHVCFCDEIRDIFRDVSSGLTDLLRKFHTSPNVYTFYDYRVKDAITRNLGWRIDHMLASESLADLAVRCWLDIAPRTWEKPSDHLPLSAEFREEL